MPKINMLSSAHKVKGQGVLSAYLEQVKLVSEGLKDNYEVIINKFKLCDIIHYHTVDFKFFLSVPFSKLKGVTVAYVHFVPETLEESLKLPYIMKKIFYKYIIWFYKSMDRLVVVNPYFIKVLRGYGVAEEKITYIPNFVSEDNFYRYDKQQIENIKKTYGINPKDFVVLGVGQVQTRKGIMDFIEAAIKIPDIQFVWAGGFSFGSITDGYAELKKVMETPPSNVKFLGIVDREKMNDIYNIADLMFLPSYSELFPMSVLEAMALKIPVLLRELDIYHDILFNLYLKGRNIEEFVNIIKDIRQKEGTYKSWCEKSWKCHNIYSKEHVLNLWRQFYDSIYQDMIKARLRRRLNAKQGT